MFLSNLLILLRLQVGVRVLSVFREVGRLKRKISPLQRLKTRLSVNQSVESKSKRGGRRPGAGRKPNLARLLKGFSREAIAEAVANVDVGAVVTSLLKSKREKHGWKCSFSSGTRSSPVLRRMCSFLAGCFMRTRWSATGLRSSTPRLRQFGRVPLY